MFRQLIDSVKKMLATPKGRIVIHDLAGNPCVLFSRPALEILLAEAYEAGASDQASGYACKENRDEMVKHWSKALKGMDQTEYET